MVVTESRLLIGPLLRHVDGDSATIWVETDRPCAVTVRAGEVTATERTWSVHGHHYAIVQLTGLAEGTVTPYEVRLDGAPVWPEPDSSYPPSVIRTLDPHRPVRLSFGSCRRTAPYDADGLKQHGADALAALAERMRGEDPETWPDALLMLGDQIYADEPSEQTTARLREAHDPVPPGHREIAEEVWNFEEYTWLYREAWTPAPVRWLLSTVPTCMLLDDHDLRDDWNTSYRWRQEVTATEWWRGRVVGALGSYWIYQHLGNLTPTDLAEDALFGEVLRSREDATAVVDAFAWTADEQRDSARWSFVRDFGAGEGRTRFVAMDCRASRLLEPRRREMIDEKEWSWIVEQATARPVAHLVLGATLPVMLPRGVHHLEGWNERVASGRYGSFLARLGEKLRRFVDLEHWSAFRVTFTRLVELLRTIVTSPDAPRSVLFLGGDVHCSYLSEGRLADTPHPRTVVKQLTMSPFRNYLPVPVKLVNKFFEKSAVRVPLRWFSRLFGADDTGLDWHVTHGPWFRNGVMTIVIDGPTARVEIDEAVHSGGVQRLERAAVRTLTS